MDRYELLHAATVYREVDVVPRTLQRPLQIRPCVLVIVDQENAHDMRRIVTFGPAVKADRQPWRAGMWICITGLRLPADRYVYGTIMTVLLVDDDAGMRGVLHRLLVRDFSVRVIEAQDGLEAVQRLLAGRVDLVILDLGMRGMGGIETLEAIRRSPTHATLPVVVLSGQADQAHVVRTRQLGIVAFIAKPFTIGSLRERLTPLVQSIKKSLGQTIVRCSLDLTPTHQVLIVDPCPEFRALLRDRLVGVCRVREAVDDPTATKLCLEQPFAAVFFSLCGDPPAVTVFRKSLERSGRRPGVVIGVVPSTDLEEARTAGLYDDVIVRSFSADTLDRSLRGAVSEPTRARLLLRDASACTAALFTAARDRAQSLLREDVTIGVPDRPGPSAGRWVQAVVGMHIASGLAWELRAASPYTAALDLSSAWLRIRSDQVSEVQVLEVAGELATELTEEVCARLQEEGVNATPRLQRVFFSRVDPTILESDHTRMGAARQLVTRAHDPALVVSLAPASL